MSQEWQKSPVVVRGGTRERDQSSESEWNREAVVVASPNSAASATAHTTAGPPTPPSTSSSSRVVVVGGGRSRAESGESGPEAGVPSVSQVGRVVVVNGNATATVTASNNGENSSNVDAGGGSGGGVRKGLTINPAAKPGPDIDPTTVEAPSPKTNLPPHPEIEQPSITLPAVVPKPVKRKKVRAPPSSWRHGAQKEVHKNPVPEAPKVSVLGGVEEHGQRPRGQSLGDGDRFAVHELAAVNAMSGITEVGSESSEDESGSISSDEDYSVVATPVVERRVYSGSNVPAIVEPGSGSSSARSIGSARLAESQREGGRVTGSRVDSAAAVHSAAELLAKAKAAAASGNESALHDSREELLTLLRDADGADWKAALLL